MAIATLQLLAGVVVLFVGGHYLVQGATRIALFARISTAVVGLTIVAMGTSLPEAFVSIGAAWRDSYDLAYANIIGSSIFNIAAILGLTALVVPIAVKSQTIKVEYPFMLFASCVVLFMCLDYQVSRIEGVVLFVAIVLFTGFIVHLARGEVAEDEAVALQREVERTANLKGGTKRAWTISIVSLVAGFVALKYGADWVVYGAQTFALAVGVDERVIGLTVVAMGTSLPELATSVVAAIKGEKDLALANVIGSNLFNLLFVLGATAALFPMPITRDAMVDIWVMLAFSAALFPLIAFGRRRVSRIDGAILVTGLVVYLAFVILAGRA